MHGSNAVSLAPERITSSARAFQILLISSPDRGAWRGVGLEDECGRVNDASTLGTWIFPCTVAEKSLIVLRDDTPLCGRSRGAHVDARQRIGLGGAISRRDGVS